MTDAFSQMMKQMLDQGQDMAKAFAPAYAQMFEQGNLKGFEAFWPTLSAEMMETWFGRTFNREGLDAKTRLLLTLGALTVLGAQAEPQIRLTIRHLLEAGATKREIAEAIWQMSLFGGMPAMQKALDIAQGVFADTEEKPA